MDGWPFWHVTLTVAGTPVPEPDIRVGLERLSHDHPFLLSGRYGLDRAEVAQRVDRLHVRRDT